MPRYDPVAAGIKTMATDAGLIVDACVLSKHYKVYVRAPDGRKGVIICGNTVSDHRAVKNQRARFLRFARDQTVYEGFT